MAPGRARAEAPGGLGRAARLAGGWALLVVGGALLVLPGPGIPLVLGGLALLAREQRWARRALAVLRRRWGRLRARLAARRGRDRA
jgi:uncharacterized protein (TIGR02611 family)